MKHALEPNTIRMEVSSAGVDVPTAWPRMRCPTNTGSPSPRGPPYPSLTPPEPGTCRSQAKRQLYIYRPMLPNSHYQASQSILQQRILSLWIEPSNPCTSSCTLVVSLSLFVETFFYVWRDGSCNHGNDECGSRSGYHLRYLHPSVESIVVQLGILLHPGPASG